MAASTEHPARRVASAGGVPFILRLYHKRIAYLLALPIVLYEAIFILYPMAVGVKVSLSSVEMGSQTEPWVGFANYQRMFSDSVFWQSIQSTIIYSVAVIVIALSVALGAALLMNRAFQGRAIFRALMTMPWAFPDIPTVIIFVWMVNPLFGVMGEFARWLPWIHSNPGWLLDTNLAMVTIVLISVWKGFPFYSLVILAALQGVPAELYEAAIVDGASAWHRFRWVTYPAILPTLMLLALLAFIFSFQQFTLIWQTTGGGPARATETLSILIYDEAFQFFDYSYAAAVGIAGFVLSMIAAVLFVFLERRARAAEER